MNAPLALDAHPPRLEAWPPKPTRAQAAWQDLAAGARRSWMCWALAVQDIRLRYRGSMLGPFWMTLTTIVMVVAMGVLYSRLFKVEITTYIPYLAISLVLWTFISTLILEGCTTFTAAEGVIQQVPLPFSIHVFRVVLRNLIILGHNLVIVPLVIAFFQIKIDWRVLEILPALVMLCVNGVWIGMLLGIISARFRDIPPIVANILQVLFFVTPIIWPIELLGHWAPIAALNPVFAAIDVLRAPLIGVATSAYSWPVLIVTTVLGCGGTFAFFARFRSRIPYWL